MKLSFSLVLLLTGAVCLAQSRIDSEEEIIIGGIRQFITIQSGDTTLPVLLFLHGGPGGSVMNYADKFTDRLRQHFIVVQWDQRQTGRTLSLNTSPLPLTLELFQNDTKEMVLYLLHRFGKHKLYLVGHSWGTALGFHIARSHPELLHAYVSIGPMINQLESEHIALELMKQRATKAGNRKAEDELAAVHIPFGSGEELYYHRKWLLEYSGSHRGLARGFVERWAGTWLSVFNEASKENLFETLPAIRCPVYILAGKKDYQTNSSIAEKYYQKLDAPKKGFYWLDSGHSIPSAEPDRMQDIIIETILPETFVKEAF